MVRFYDENIRVRNILKKLYKSETGRSFGLFLLAKLIKYRLKQDRDLYGSLEGETGVGKSSLQVMLLLLINSPNFDLEKHVAYIPDSTQIKKQFNKLKQYQCMGIDEAIKAFYKMDFMSRLQKDLVQMANTERFQNKAILMCIPNFSDLSKTFRDTRVDIRIWIPFRGKAIVYKKHNDKDLADKWHTDEVLKYKTKKWAMDKWRGKRIIDPSHDDLMRMEMRNPNYIMDFDFPELKVISPILFNEYLRLKVLSNEVENSVEEIGVNKELIQRNNLIFFLKEYNPYKFSYAKIAEIALMSASTVKDVITKERLRRRKENPDDISGLDPAFSQPTDLLTASKQAEDQEDHSPNSVLAVKPLLTSNKNILSPRHTSKAVPISAEIGSTESAEDEKLPSENWFENQYQDQEDEKFTEEKEDTINSTEPNEGDE